MLTPLITRLGSSAAVLSLDEVKTHLRVDAGDDDAVIAGLIDAVVADLDGATGWLGRSLGQQTLAVTAGAFPGDWDGDGSQYDWSFGCARWPLCTPLEIRLPCPPVQSVTSVVYRDQAGVSQTLDPATYALADRVLFPVAGAPWPATGIRPDAVTITYVAGYADGELPAPIRAALLLRIGALYAGRNDGPALTTAASDALLAPWRVFA